jgi:nucleotide-binding universal stress UspA family protein
MTRFQTILVPVDFSAHSDKALDCALMLAKTFGARVHLLHAYHLPIQVATPDQVIIPRDFWTAVRDSAARKLEKALQKIAVAGIEGETHLAELPPAQAITQTAETISADLIVMGTRGLTGLKHVLLGSVAERTIRSAPCPVMTVKDESD